MRAVHVVCFCFRFCRCWVVRRQCNCFFFFFNDTATTEIYTLSLHDALPICVEQPFLSEIPKMKAISNKAGGSVNPRFVQECNLRTVLWGPRYSECDHNVTPSALGECNAEIGRAHV